MFCRGDDAAAYGVRQRTVQESARSLLAAEAHVIAVMSITWRGETSQIGHAGFGNARA